MNVSGLLVTLSLIGLVGCYSNIPAAMPEAVCQISRSIRKESAITTSSRAEQERIVVDGKSVDVYFVSSVRYSYDLQRRLTREQTTGYRNAYDEEFSYAPDRLYNKTVYYAQDGSVSDVHSYSVGLNAQGYVNRRTYNEKWQDGNLMHKEESAVDYMVNFDYSYDLSRPASLNPRQFVDRPSKNLLMSLVIFPTVSGKNNFTYTYYSDSQRRVKRMVLQVKHEFLSPIMSYTNIYVTDYEYNCL